MKLVCWHSLFFKVIIDLEAGELREGEYYWEMFPYQLYKLGNLFFSDLMLIEGSLKWVKLLSEFFQIHQF